MPGRAFVGLTPEEKHPAEFRPERLPDEPSISLGRVVVGVVTGLILFGFGTSLHTEKLRISVCNKVGALKHPAGCARPLGSGVPVIVWLSVAALVTTVLIAWPYLRSGIRRWRGAKVSDGAI